MDKMFVYEVNGTAFEGYEPWGEAWKNAEALAKTEHAPIFRQIVKGEDIRSEVFVFGMFVRDTEENRAKALIF